jgi:hypothetical protein
MKCLLDMKGSIVRRKRMSALDAVPVVVLARIPTKALHVEDFDPGAAEAPTCRTAP